MFGANIDHKDGDPRIADALDALKIKYTIDRDGDFRMVFELSDGRSQIGFIKSRTYNFAGVELREIFSAGLRSEGPFDSRTCNLLLKENARVKIGAWQVQSNSEDEHMALFSVAVAAELSAEELLAVLMAVLKTADEMEQRLDGRDDF